MPDFYFRGTLIQYWQAIYADYLKEAYRTLKFGGLLKIAEPISRWQGKRAELLSEISAHGFLLVGEVTESNQFLYIDAIKE